MNRYKKPLLDMDVEESRIQRIFRQMFFDRQRNELVAFCVLTGIAIGSVGMYYLLQWVNP